MSFAQGTPTALIELGGKTYELGFTVGAMQRSNELGVLNVDTSDGTAFILAMPQFIWACLPSDADREELSAKAIAELLNPTNITPIAAALGKLFRASIPEPDVKTNPGAATELTPGQSTSTNSGHLVGTT